MPASLIHVGVVLGGWSLSAYLHALASRAVCPSWLVVEHGVKVLRRIDREETPGAEEALSAVANTWLPISIAHAHYRACDTLGISESDILAAMITADGGQVRRTWHAQIMAAAQKPDAAPWLLLPQIPKWWPRSAQGGGMALYRQGPTQARVQYRACSLNDIPFYRDSSRGVLFIFVSHFCRDLKITTIPNQKPGSMSFQLRWR